MASLFDVNKHHMEMHASNAFLLYLRAGIPVYQAADSLPCDQSAFDRYYLPPGLWETSLTEEDFVAASADLKQALQRAAKPPREELYDLHDDPQELVNLAEEEALQSTQNHLRSALVQWQTELDDRIADPEVLSALAEMHEQIARDFYPEGVGPPTKGAAIPWDYALWIDPGVPA